MTNEMEIDDDIEQEQESPNSTKKEPIESYHRGSTISIPKALRFLFCILSYQEIEIINRIVSLSTKYVKHGGCNLRNEILARRQQCSKSIVTQAIAKATWLGILVHREDVVERKFNKKIGTYVSQKRILMMQIPSLWEELGKIWGEFYFTGDSECETFINWAQGYIVEAYKNGMKSDDFGKAFALAILETPYWKTVWGAVENQEGVKRKSRGGLFEMSMLLSLGSKSLGSKSLGSSSLSNEREDSDCVTTPPSFRRKKIPIEDSTASDKRSKKVKFNGNTADINEIISIWIAAGLCIIDSTERRIAQNYIDALLNGTFFENKLPYKNQPKANRQYSKEEILQSIQNFATATFSEDHEPSDTNTKERMKETPIARWFWNGLPNIKQKSQFLQNLKSPRLIEKEIPDEAPRFTSSIKRLWAERILRQETVEKWSCKDENNFRKTGILLKTFFDEKVRESYSISTPWDKAKILFEVFEQNLNGKKPETSWLHRPWIFDTNLPNHLIRIGLLEDQTYGA
jgi:hypothetical protein